MKRIIFIISAFILLFLTLGFPIYAQKENVILGPNDTVNRDYFAGGERVQLSGTVNGDAYVGGSIIIVDGTINGDLLTGGGNVTISGNVTGDVRVGGGNITFSGATIGGNVTSGGGNITYDQTTQIAGSLVAGGGNIQIFAPIGKGATIGGGTVLLGNTVGGDIMAGVGELSLSSQAAVNGDLTYWSEQRANVAQGATVSGTLRQERPPADNQTRQEAKEVGATIAGIFFGIKLIDLLWLLLIGTVLIALLPNFAERTQTFIRINIGWALLIGFITVIFLPVLGVLLLMTVIGIPLAIFLFFAFLVIIWIARIFAIYALGKLVFQTQGNKKARIAAYLVGLIIYAVLSIIPFINFITDILITLSGIGGLLAMKKVYYTDLRNKKII